MAVETSRIATSSQPTTAHKSLSRFAWAVLAYNVGVILWGAYVRATGSGAGCGNHWPLCGGVVIPRAEHVQTMIEFTHRVSSGLALLMVVGLWIWSRVTLPRKHPSRYAAGAASIFMLSEALLGASLVLFEHVAQDKSFARVLSLSLHSVNTMLLLAAIAVTALWLHRPALPQAWTWRKAAPSLTVLVLILGAAATGAVTALGDTLFPASSLAASVAQDFAHTSHYILRLRLAHPVVAVIAALFVLWVALPLRRAESSLLRNVSGVAGAVLILQLVLGVFNVMLLAPVWLQMIHLLAADLLWISMVLLSALWVDTPGSRTASF